MTEEHRLLLVVAFVVIALICVARWPGLLAGLIGRPTARCRDGSHSFSFGAAARARTTAGSPNFFLPRCGAQRCDDKADGEE